MEEEKVQHVSDHDSEQLEVKEMSVDQMDPQQKLFYFAKRGDVEGLKGISNSGFDINAPDNSENVNNPYKSLNTALHYAVMSGSLETVKVCFDLQAQLERKNKLESTPLHLAASYGYTEIAQYLIEKKASLDATNKVQNKPLHCAVYAGHVELVQYILGQLDDPKMALLEPNGVGMGAVKYTAHDPMKQLLRTYFPKTNAANPTVVEDAPEEEEKENNPTVVEDES